MSADLILIVLALICFLVGAVDVRTPPVRPNWTNAGLALLTLAWLITRGK